MHLTLNEHDDDDDDDNDDTAQILLYVLWKNTYFLMFQQVMLWLTCDFKL